VVGYQGHRSIYRPQTTQIAHRKDPFFNLNPLVPKVKEFKDINENPAFTTVTDGFQRAVNLHVAPGRTGEERDLKLPVVGYTGHRTAYKA